VIALIQRVAEASVSVSGETVGAIGKGVLALVGGYDAAPGFDRATRALRQPGSAFKPIVYAAALDGDSPARFLDLVVNPARLAQAKLDRLREILDSATVAEHMSRDPVVIAPGATLDDAAQLMKERKVNRLPVVEKGRLVGILTRHDVLNAL